MIRQVFENIYLIELGLPNNPLKSISIYVIKGKGKSLIIDTGFNQEECVRALFQGLDQIGIDIGKTELFITHLHSDHSGMANLFSDKGVRIYTSKIDGDLINEMTTDEYWNRFEELKVLLDLDQDKVDFLDHPGYKFCIKEPIEFHYLEEGNIIEIDDYKFEVIDIKGHTPGQIGLYERNHKLFFGGDHVLDPITPNIQTWEIGDNILTVYLNSLGKIYNYEIDTLFPSHRNIIRDHKKRVGELIKHHNDRLEEVLNILDEDGYTVRNVAKKMDWRIRAKSFEDFPAPQKWFATGEAVAHLEHLYINKKIGRRLEDNKFIYYKF